MGFNIPQYDVKYKKIVLAYFDDNCINATCRKSGDDRSMTCLSYYILLRVLKIRVENSIKIKTVRNILSNSVSFFRSSSTVKLITNIVEDSEVIA